MLRAELQGQRRAFLAPHAIQRIHQRAGLRGNIFLQRQHLFIAKA